VLVQVRGRELGGGEEKGRGRREAPFLSHHIRVQFTWQGDKHKMIFSQDGTFRIRRFGDAVEIKRDHSFIGTGNVDTI
jgi:hypothetical protein